MASVNEMINQELKQNFLVALRDFKNQDVKEIEAKYLTPLLKMQENLNIFVDELQTAALAEGYSKSHSNSLLSSRLTMKGDENFNSFNYQDSTGRDDFIGYMQYKNRANIEILKNKREQVQKQLFKISGLLEEFREEVTGEEIYLSVAYETVVGKGGKLSEKQALFPKRELFKEENFDTLIFRTGGNQAGFKLESFIIGTKYTNKEGKKIDNRRARGSQIQKIESIANSAKESAQNKTGPYSSYMRSRIGVNDLVENIKRSGEENPSAYAGDTRSSSALYSLIWRTFTQLRPKDTPLPWQIFELFSKYAPVWLNANGKYTHVGREEWSDIPGSLRGLGADIMTLKNGANQSNQKRGDSNSSIESKYMINSLANYVITVNSILGQLQSIIAWLKAYCSGDIDIEKLYKHLNKLYFDDSDKKALDTIVEDTVRDQFKDLKKITIKI